jgi:hypothetical protein
MIGCPNDPPCGHYLHDVWDREDPYPSCCTEGCRCGHPGDATLRRADDGTVTVLRADPVVRVARELYTEWGLHPDEVWTLDTAGEYRYRFLRDEGGPAGIIYGRIEG